MLSRSVFRNRMGFCFCFEEGNRGSRFGTRTEMEYDREPSTSLRLVYVQTQPMLVLALVGGHIPCWSSRGEVG